MTGEPYLVTTKAHMSAVMELHTLCFGSDEQTKITYALLDKSHFSLLAGCDEDGQPTGYAVYRVQDEVSYGLWLGVSPNSRGEGLGRKLTVAAINESLARGAEYIDSHISENNPTSAMTLRMHKNLGFTLVRSFTDTYINDDGERVEFTCNHVQLSLTEEGDYNE